MGHCEDNLADRAKGAKAELVFARQIAGCRTITAAHQDVVRELFLQDCRVLDMNSHGDIAWLNRQKKHLLAEVKEKYPTSWGAFGLEEYRLQGLISMQKGYDAVCYLIHDTSWPKWRIAWLPELMADGGEEAVFPTYYAGQKVMAKGRYWKVSLWHDWVR